MKPSQSSIYRETERLLELSIETVERLLYGYGETGGYSYALLARPDCRECYKTEKSRQHGKLLFRLDVAHKELCYQKKGTEQDAVDVEMLLG